MEQYVRLWEEQGRVGFRFFCWQGGRNGTGKDCSSHQIVVLRSATFVCRSISDQVVWCNIVLLDESTYYQVMWLVISFQKHHSSCQLDSYFLTCDHFFWFWEGILVGIYSTLVFDGVDRGKIIFVGRQYSSALRSDTSHHFLILCSKVMVWFLIELVNN